MCVTLDGDVLALVFPVMTIKLSSGCIATLPSLLSKDTVSLCFHLFSLRCVSVQLLSILHLLSAT